MQITLKSKRTVILSDSEDEEKISKSEASKKNKNSPEDINVSKITSRTVISSGELFKKKPITRIEESKMKKLQQKVSTIYQVRIKRLMNILASNIGICRNRSFTMTAISMLC